jgi:hypothetical protein
MTIQTISMPKKEAEKEWKNYRDVLKNRSEKYLEELYYCFSHMKRGRKLIDIIELMKEIGLNEKEQPRMAIANCSFKEIIFSKSNDGSGEFKTNNSNFSREKKFIVKLPSQTFKNWSRLTDEEFNKLPAWNRNRIKNIELKTKVPIVPAQFLPKGKLENYYILWEVDKWEEIPPRRDPILLKRLSENLFAILSVWKLSRLEQSIIRGR